MGDTLEEIAQSLSSTIPQGGTLYTADSRAAALFREKCGEKDCRLVLCPAESVAQENISIAREVAASLGVTGEEFNRSLSAVRGGLWNAQNLPDEEQERGSFPLS